MMQRTLPARQPFLFHSVVQSHGWYQLAPWQWDATNGTLQRPEQLSNGRIVQLALAHHPEGLTVYGPDDLTAAEIGEISENLHWIFNLGADLNAFYALADQEPRLSHCRPKAQGRFLRSATLFEDIVKVMATTNIQWSGTKRLVRQLVNTFGQPLPQDATLHAFPTPQSIASSDEATLRALGWGYRSPYLLKLAQGVISGAYDLAALRASGLPTPELRKQLLKLPGIGPYAAATLLGLLGRHDYIGVDSEAMSLVSKHFYNGQPVGEKEINAVFARWGEFKSLAYWFWDYAGTQQTPMEAWTEQK